MNAKHLGDALDHWKGSIIQRMEGLLERIAVIPMITDDKPWDDKKIETYSRLLSVDRKLVMKVMEWNKTTRENRGDYFRNIHHRGDLFLDPDIGVTIREDEYDHKHVRVDEIGILIGKNQPPKRIILIYQHRGRESLCKQVKTITKKVISQMEKVSATTYECGNVAMLFFSYDKDRIERTRKHLVDMLSGDPMNRIRIWP